MAASVLCKIQPTLSSKSKIVLREKYPNMEFFSGPYFPAFGLNTERYGVSHRIQSECGKIRTWKNSVFGHFSRSICFHEGHILSHFVPRLLRWFHKAEENDLQPVSVAVFQNTCILLKRSSEKFRKTHRKTPVPLLNEVVNLQLATLLKWDCGTGVSL